MTRPDHRAETGQGPAPALLKSEGVDLSRLDGGPGCRGGDDTGDPGQSLRLVMGADKDNLQFATEQKPQAEAPPGPLDRLVAVFADGVVAELVALQAAPGGGRVRRRRKRTQRPRPSRRTRVSTSKEASRPGSSWRTWTWPGLCRGASTCSVLVPVADPGPAQPESRCDYPAGQLRDLKDYAFHGDLTLSGRRSTRWTRPAAWRRSTWPTACSS